MKDRHWDLNAFLFELSLHRLDSDPLNLFQEQFASAVAPGDAASPRVGRCTRVLQVYVWEFGRMYTLQLRGHLVPIANPYPF